MHIEPGLVDASKIFLSYATGAAALGYSARLALDMLRKEGAGALLLRSLVATALVFASFEILPHHPVGVSEVHLILGTTLLLMLGAAPAAIGLAAGLLVQSLFFAPQDLPQYGMNVTTLLVPLFATAALARRIIPRATAYVDLTYTQTLKLSLAYQGGIVAWVAFWALYGQGVGAGNLQSIASFGAAYMGVVLLEPLVDLAVLAGAKALRGLQGSALLQSRVYSAV
ncbi:energy-coupling factor ABC transporter permease [Diaphorobacter limosus]|jgi:ABC-type Co2+ transport system permease subunit|uniref:Energy-coupling factor ABC transporter permease n=1 Tax=Diaphorobacter limosus TaxID=3036128 RepID=A0ABZ0J3Y3_9BURK|nr:energy-coupling factor ABC transporter permease [Diaphorobacter sp. Y-1]WOO32331.1 energy-coupling factor ABC transporter permease [Diaphorobacter sp. Y-1]